MNKSVLLGTFVLLLVAFFGIKGMLAGIKTGDNCSMHELNVEVKVIDHLSGKEGHADICVIGNGALIIKKLTAETATVYTRGADMLVIIKETGTQVEFNTNNTSRKFLLVNREHGVNTRALEQFALNTHLGLGDKYPGYHEGIKALEHLEQE